MLLEKAGLLKLNSNIDKASYTLKDIKSNPKNLKIKELDAAGIQRVLPDVALAAINTNYAILADLTPSEDAIFLENKDSIYANIVVINKKDVNTDKLQKLKASLQSEEVAKKAKELFKNQAILAY